MEDRELAGLLARREEQGAEELLNKVITTALSAPGAMLVILLMYLGRVGILSFSIAFITRTRYPAKIKYPEMNVMIG